MIQLYFSFPFHCPDFVNSWLVYRDILNYLEVVLYRSQSTFYFIFKTLINVVKTKVIKLVKVKRRALV